MVKQQYVTTDGKSFDTKEQAEKHETDVETKRAEARKELEAERKAAEEKRIKDEADRYVYIQDASQVYEIGISKTLATRLGEMRLEEAGFTRKAKPLKPADVKLESQTYNFNILAKFVRFADEVLKQIAPEDAKMSNHYVKISLAHSELLMLEIETEVEGSLRFYLAPYLKE